MFFFIGIFMLQWVIGGLASSILVLGGSSMTLISNLGLVVFFHIGGPLNLLLYLWQEGRICNRKAWSDNVERSDGAGTATGAYSLANLSTFGRTFSLTKGFTHQSNNMASRGRQDS